MRKKKRRRFRLTHFIFLMIIFYISKTLISQGILTKELTNRKAMEEQEIAKLEKEIEELNKEIENKDSLTFIEKVARDELRMVKPREIIYIDKNKNNNPFMNFKK